MTAYTQEQIAQALMINYKSEIVSNIDRERKPSHQGAISLFNIQGITRNARLHMVYLPREGELIEYQLAPVRVHNSVSNVPSYRNRVQYVQVSMDNKASITDDGRKVVRNSNPYLFGTIFMSKTLQGPSGKIYNNMYNCIEITGFLRLAPVPSQHNNAQLVAAYNKASEDIRKAHAAVKASSQLQGTDLATNQVYRATMEKLYAKYQEDMKALIKAGHVQLTQVYNADDGTIKPTFQLDSEHSDDNPYLDATSMLKNHISYMPTLNIFFGFATINSNASVDDINGDLTTGLRTLGKEDENTEVVSTRAKRQEATRLATISDSFGNQTSLLLRRQDQGYINPRNTNQQGLAEIFNNATANNESVFFRGKYLPVVATKDVGGNANGILRGTIVLDEYTKQQTMSLSSSIEGDVNVFDSLTLDNASEMIGGLDFTSESTDNSEDSMMIDSEDNMMQDDTPVISTPSKNQPKSSGNTNKVIL